MSYVSWKFQSNTAKKLLQSPFDVNPICCLPPVITYSENKEKCNPFAWPTHPFRILNHSGRKKVCSVHVVKCTFHDLIQRLGSLAFHGCHITNLLTEQMCRQEAINGVKQYSKMVFLHSSHWAHLDWHDKHDPVRVLKTCHWSALWTPSMSCSK